MATVGPGPYYVAVVLRSPSGSLRNELVSRNVSRRIAFADAIDLLAHGYSEGGRRYDVVSLTVRKRKGR